ncbi:MAG: HNH endonuclease [Mycobacteriales bacterium]
MAWKQAIYKAGGYRCAVCGTDRRLEAHHVRSVRDFPELRHDLSNGVCLCHDCHYYGVHGGAPNFIHGRYSRKPGG